MGPLPLWWDDRERRLSHWFILGSLAVHLGLIVMFLHGFPLVHRSTDAPGPPLMVTILDPDAVNELPIGPITNLPPKPTNLVPAPRSREVLPPFAAAPPADQTGRAPSRESSIRELEAGDPAARLPPDRGAESARGAAAPGQTAPPVAPGLPFVNREEINRMARLFTDEPRAPKAPYSVNTEDLQYLSYIAQIARTLEMIWRYPREAGERGQHGVTVLKVIIREDGTLHAAQLIESSGYPLLDGEALRAVKRIAPYPPLPKSWHRAQWELTISFAYLLHGVSVGVI